MDPLSITASGVAIIGAIVKSYDTIERIQGFPKALDEVKKHLPLVQKILQDAGQRFQSTTLDEHENKTVLETVRHCEEKAKMLKGIFDELENKFKED
ncbi:hypothetical protein EsH8_IV_001060 [Colletotrichum jinshuiense]